MLKELKELLEKNFSVLQRKAVMGKNEIHSLEDAEADFRKRLQGTELSIFYKDFGPALKAPLQEAGLWDDAVRSFLPEQKQSDIDNVKISLFDIFQKRDGAERLFEYIEKLPEKTQKQLLAQGKKLSDPLQNVEYQPDPSVKTAKERFAGDAEFLAKLDEIGSTVFTVDNMGGFLESKNKCYQDYGTERLHQTQRILLDTDPALNRFAKENMSVSKQPNLFMAIDPLGKKGYTVESQAAAHAAAVESFKNKAKTDPQHIADLKTLLKTVRESVYVREPNFMAEQGKKIYGMKKYYDARLELSKAMRDGSKEVILAKAEELGKQEKFFEKLYADVEHLLPDLGIDKLPGNINASRESDIPFRLRSNDRGNILVNSAYYLLNVADKFGFDAEKLIEDPASVFELFKEKQDFYDLSRSMPQGSKADVLFALGNERPGVMDPNSAFSLIRAINVSLMGLEDQDMASVMCDFVNYSTVAVLSAKSGVLQDLHGPKNRTANLERLILSPADVKTAAEVYPHGDFDVCTFKSSEVKQLSDYTKENYLCPGANGFKNAARLYAEFADMKNGKYADLAGNPSFKPFSLDEFTAIAVKNAMLETERLKTVKTPEAKAAVKQLNEFLKNPTAVFEREINAVCAEKKLNTDVVKKEFSAQLPRAARTAEALKKTYAPTAKKYAALLKNSDKKLADAEKAALKEDKALNKKLTTAKKNLDKLGTTIENTAEPAKRDELQKKINDETALLTGLQDSAAKRLEKAYLDGRVTEHYFLKRSEQIFKLDLKEEVRFSADAEKSAKNMSAEDLAAARNAYSAERLTRSEAELNGTTAKRAALPASYVERYGVKPAAKKAPTAEAPAAPAAKAPAADRKKAAVEIPKKQPAKSPDPKAADRNAPEKTPKI